MDPLRLLLVLAIGVPLFAVLTGSVVTLRQNGTLRPRQWGAIWGVALLAWLGTWLGWQGGSPLSADAATTLVFLCVASIPLALALLVGWVARSFRASPIATVLAAVSGAAVGIVVSIAAFIVVGCSLNGGDCF